MFTLFGSTILVEHFLRVAVHIVILSDKIYTKCQLLFKYPSNSINLPFCIIFRRHPLSRLILQGIIHPRNNFPLFIRFLILWYMKQYLNKKSFFIILTLQAIFHEQNVQRTLSVMLSSFSSSNQFSIVLLLFDT